MDRKTKTNNARNTDEQKTKLPRQTANTQMMLLTLTPCENTANHDNHNTHIRTRKQKTSQDTPIPQSAKTSATKIAVNPKTKHHGSHPPKNLVRHTHTHTNKNLVDSSSHGSKSILVHNRRHCTCMVQTICQTANLG